MVASEARGAKRERVAAGTICMEFSRRADRTVATRLYRHGNSRISSEIRVPGAEPYYFLISTGGGYTEGEHYDVDIRVGEGAHAVLTTQTPSYIYKCDNGLLTTQSQCTHVGAGGLLEYYADEVMPYANARFRQRTQIALEEGASLVYVEGLSSGWSPDEKPFRFRDALLSTEVRVGGTLVAVGRLAAAPGEGCSVPIEGMGGFEGYTNFGSALIVGQALGADDVQGFRDAVAAELPDGVRAGVSSLDRWGVVLRCPGMDEQRDTRAIQAFVRHYREGLRSLKPLMIRKNRN
jgi:urease accessory protein